MNTAPDDAQRRSVLQISAGLAAAGSAMLQGAQAATASTSPASAPSSMPTPPAPAPTGRAGDFNFLSGEWTIANRQLRNGAWDSFEGEATVHGILAGVGSVEELRIPARNFSGMGLRLLDVERRLWADHWVNARSGVLTPPPSWGSFEGGVGIWDSHDQDGGKPVIYRGMWDRITPTSCRWTQASSRDGGKTWLENWLMHWTRR